MNTWIKIALAASLAVLATGCASKSVSADGTPPVAVEGKAPGIAGYFSSTHPVTIPAGTLLRIRTRGTLSTRSTRTGETVEATLESPLVVSGVVLAPQGATAVLLVADSDPGGRVKGKAKIGLQLTAMQLTGTIKPVATNIAWFQAHATKRKDAAKIGILSGIGAAIGAVAGGGKGAAIGAGAGGGAGTALVLSTHGDPAVIPAESVLQFQLQQPITINVRS